jgi:hypothetical protein
MKISMLSAFAATENNAGHFARRELMQQAAGGCHLLISEAQIAPQVSLPDPYAHECNLPHSHFVRHDWPWLGVAASASVRIYRIRRIKSEWRSDL